jgi:signal transduction histidine kinase
MSALWQSMTSRVFLALCVGVLASALITAGLALHERQRMVGEFRDFHAAGRVAQFILSLDTIPAEQRAPFYSATASGGMRAEPARASEPVLATRSELAALLEQRLPDGYQIASTPTRAGDCAPTPGRAHMRRHTEGRGPCEALLITLHDGERLRLSVLPPRPPQFLPRIDPTASILVFLFFIGLLAAVIARMTMRPLKRLAEAATELGKDIDRAPMPETGAREIRQAAAAFNAMQARIRQHIGQRTQILAAISHDLQTPLTRLRLRLEKVDDEELREKLVSDLSAMQQMVREGLELARSMDSGEPMQMLDLDSLIDSACSDAADAGEDVHVEGLGHGSVRARPAALRRCLDNLIDNAVKYGRYARVSSRRDGAQIIISVRDGGPGIPAHEQDKVFEPFYRLEASRSRETGGTGLGLTIARNIAEQHGGSLRLQNRDNGLEVLLTLPCADTARQ